jgi:hypothetical protein
MFCLSPGAIDSHESSTVLADNLHRSEVTMFPLALKLRSEGADVAGMAK